MPPPKVVGKLSLVVDFADIRNYGRYILNTFA